MMGYRASYAYSLWDMGFGFMYWVMIFTWIVLMAFFILGSVYFWKRINEKERRK